MSDANPSNPLRRCFTGGLTLVELLVAMAILVTVSTSAALIFRGIVRAWRTGELRTERYQQARLLFDLFGRELSSTIASSRYPLISTSPGGEIPRLKPTGMLDELFFAGTFPGRPGVVERGYWVSSEGDLMCHDDEPADGDYSTGMSDLCGQDVTEFSVSLFDGTEWVDHWDGRSILTEEVLLPKAVHIVLTVGRKKPEKFETVIYVPTS